jgi:adenine-specific DNA-methyltransferase
MTKPDGEIAKFDLKSEDILERRRQELLRLFPEAHTESSEINFDALRASLGDFVSVGPESFGMTWPGKAECSKLIHRQSIATLIPAVEESVNWETTQNVVIEGDNLEVLKVLQKAYLGKVKMIYIDPPYNTGNDFIYPDDFTESLKTYLQYTGQVDDEGRNFSSNTESSGRFHSKWLNLMYPRLSLARDLLTEDGLLFVSISDVELSNLRRILDEIFGESNHVETFIWESIFRPSNMSKTVRRNAEYIICFSKSDTTQLEMIEREQEPQGEASLTQNNNKVRVLKFPPNFVHCGLTNGNYRAGKYGEVELMQDLFVENGKISREFSISGKFKWSQDYLNEEIEKGVFLTIKTESMIPYYRKDYQLTKLRPTKILPRDLVGDVLAANAEINRLFGVQVFDYPKPTSLVLQLMRMASVKSDDLVLDFFAGSGTTGHAVMQANNSDRGNRKYVLVQMPEPLNEASEGWKLGYRTISDIARDRLRRAGNQIAGESQTTLKLEKNDAVDVGFRSFHMSNSNFAVWEANAIEGDEKKLEQQLFAQVEHILPGRTNQDVLFELMLKSRYGLTTAVESVKIGKCEVWKVANGEMVAVIGTGMSVEVIREIATWKPLSVVILDRCFAGDDSLKANARKIFEDARVDLKTV